MDTLLILDCLENGKIVSAKHNKVNNCLEYVFRLHDKEYHIEFGNADEVIDKDTNIRSRSLLNELIFVGKYFLLG